MPPNIDPALLDQWNKAFDKFWLTLAIDGHALSDLLNDRERRKLSFVAGCWLKEELLASGCLPPDLIRALKTLGKERLKEILQAGPRPDIPLP